MPADCFFDTTILVYAAAQTDRRTAVAEELLVGGGRISVHVLNEFVAVARRKLRMPWKEVLEATTVIRTLCDSPLPLTMEIHEDALRICQRYKYHIYDSLIIAAALESSCTVLYSEDMQDGQVIDSLHIRNPFGNA
jgi:predicted nucleic acid-binding protein